MLALEVLQRYILHNKILTSIHRWNQPFGVKHYFLDIEQSESHLSHQLALQIIVGCLNKNIFHTVIDEGEDHFHYVFVMLESHWFSSTHHISNHLEIF
jgi:hypothetical protein